MRSTGAVILLTVAVGTVLAGCGLNVDTDHLTVSTAAEPLDDAGPEPGSLAEAWEITLDGEPDGYHLIAGQVVTVVGDGLRAYDATTGEPTWHYLEPGRKVWALGESDGAIVLETYLSTTEGDSTYIEDSHLVGLDAGTGEELWENTDDWSLSVEGSAGSSGTTQLADAAAGVVVVEPGDTSVRAGIEARTGEEIWRFENRDAAPGCSEEIADDAGEADGDLVLLDLRCEMPDAVLVAVDAETGEFRWRRPASNNGNPGSGKWMGLAENVALDGDNATPPVLIGPDGSELFTGEAGSKCPCDLYSSGGTLVLDYSGADSGAVVSIDPATGTVTPLGDPAGNTLYPGGMAEAGGRIYGPHTAAPLLPAMMTVVDAASGERHVVPLPHGPRGTTQVTWLDAAGGRLFVARQEVAAGDVAPSGPPTLTSYLVNSAAEPVELGGVAPGDWPDACAVVGGMPAPQPGDDDYDEDDVDAAPYVAGEPAVVLGELTLPVNRCSSEFGDERRVAVDIRWVAATEDEAVARLAKVEEQAADDVESERDEEAAGEEEEAPVADIEVPGADDAIDLGDGSIMIRVGRTIATVSVNTPEAVRESVLTTLTANLRASGGI